MVFGVLNVGQGDTECIDRVTAELRFENEHIKGHHCCLCLYPIMSKVDANISLAFWVASFWILASADGPQHTSAQAKGTTYAGGEMPH